MNRVGGMSRETLAPIFDDPESRTESTKGSPPRRSAFHPLQVLRPVLLNRGKVRYPDGIGGGMGDWQGINGMGKDRISFSTFTG
jgi:hypothetical protein